MALEDINEKTNKVRVGFGVFFGILTILAPIYSPQFKVLLGIIFFLLSTLFLWFGKKLVKMFSKELRENVTLSDSFSVVVKDKDGNIKDRR